MERVKSSRINGVKVKNIGRRVLMVDPRVDKVSIDSLKLLVSIKLFKLWRGWGKICGEILTVFTLALLDKCLVLDVVVTRLAVEPSSKRIERKLIKTRRPSSAQSLITVSLRLHFVR